jgi:DNA-binding GntR family transcriptional regulator
MEKVLSSDVKLTRKSEPNPSQRSLAYEEIKQRIITLVYKPGSYLNEAMLSDDLEFGKTPIRQAIDQLRLEGMLDVLPRKGLIVRPVSFDEIKQIANVRLVLEGHCAALAADRINASDLEKLSDILSKTKDFAEAQDTAELMKLDREFHSTISNACREQVLAEILLGLHDRSLRFWFISLSEKHQVANILKEHKKIFAALQSRNPEAARLAAEDHIRSFLKNISADI